MGRLDVLVVFYLLNCRTSMLAGAGLVVLPGVIGSSSGIFVSFDGSSLVVLLSYFCELRYSLLILLVPVCWIIRIAVQFYESDIRL